MFRYLAFAWNDADGSQQQAAAVLVRRVERQPRAWRGVLKLPRLAVYCSGVLSGSTEPHVLEGRRGVVLGRIFARGAEDVARGPAGFDACASARIEATGGRCLIEDYWGRYVAFIRDGTADSIRVLRDPTGGLRCFSTSFEGVTIFFCHAEDCLQFGLSFSIDFDFVAAHLASRGLPECAATGLQEVSTVLAGECLNIGRDRLSRTFYWNPFLIAAGDRIDDPAPAIEDLRSAVRTCVRAWASCYDGILHKLSGGLDSAIVLSCLQNPPVAPRVVCLNRYSAGADGDERAYARLAARRAGCALIEQQTSTTVDLEHLLRMPRSVCPSPNGRLHLLVIGRAVQAMARTHGAQAVFSGEYGDLLFHRHPAMPAAIDFASLYGLRPALFNVALDVSRLAGTSIWQVLRRAITDGLLARPTWVGGFADTAYGEARIAELIDRQSKGARERFSHPWFASAGVVPIGKRGHVSRVAFNTFLPDDSLAEEGQLDDVMPLYSQPIVEVSLRIALPLLVKGGWDRSIARRAFARDLPREIVTRRTKGGTEQYVRDVLFGNIEFVRETLFAGVLAREGMLDRHQLEGVLAGRPSASQTTTSDLYWMLGTEAWLRSWQEVRQNALQSSHAVVA